MYMFVIITYIVPIVLMLIGFRRLALWIAALITMMLVFIVATGIGIGFHWAAGSSEEFRNFKLNLSLARQVEYGGHSLLALAFLYPWAAMVDFFMASTRIGFTTMSIWIFIFQAIGIFTNLMIWGVTAETVREMTHMKYLRDKAEGKA